MKSVDLVALVLRLSLGPMMVAHGLNKVRGANGLNGTANWFRSMGMRWPRAQARIASFGEILSGLMLTVGLFTSLAGSAIVALMIVAIVTVHRRVGFFVFLPGGGWEYCSIIAASSSATVLNGAGRVSLDHLFGIRVSTTGGGVLLAIGIVAAFLHLVVSWRPAHPAPATTIL